MLHSPRLTAEELNESVIRHVRVHIGERWVMMLLGLTEVGYTLGRDTVLQTPGNYSSVKVNVTKMVMARVNDQFYQVIEHDGMLHLYLPSVVDEDNKHVWSAN